MPQTHNYPPEYEYASTAGGYNFDSGGHWAPSAPAALESPSLQLARALERARLNDAAAQRRQERTAWAAHQAEEQARARERERERQATREYLNAFDPALGRDPADQIARSNAEIERRRAMWDAARERRLRRLARPPARARGGGGSASTVSSSASSSFVTPPPSYDVAIFDRAPPYPYRGAPYNPFGDEPPPRRPRQNPGAPQPIDLPLGANDLRHTGSRGHSPDNAEPAVTSKRKKWRKRLSVGAGSVGSFMSKTMMAATM
jgi:hypothetical protein